MLFNINRGFLLIIIEGCFSLTNKFYYFSPISSIIVDYTDVCKLINDNKYLLLIKWCIFILLYAENNIPNYIIHFLTIHKINGLNISSKKY